MKTVLFRNCILFTIAITGTLSCSKKNNGTNVTPPTTPEANISGVRQERSTSNSTFEFKVSLSSKASADVSLHYTTAESSAKQGVDFVATAGTVTIPAGQTNAAIDVTVAGDSLRKPNQTFLVQLSQPVNCIINTSDGTGTIVNEDGLYYPVDNAGYVTPETYAGYTLAWSDEFNGKTINTDNWSYDLGGEGWGNNELENYTDRTQNSFVSDGHLIIEARAENYQGNQYTSARMITKNKEVFKYGRVDIRAKLPKTKGIWPALWMLGNNIDQVSWPACGEIDIMELLGQDPTKMYSTLHYGASAATHNSFGTNYTLTGDSFDQQFHVFSMEWKQDNIAIFVDDKQVFFCNRTKVGDPYPFNNPFFFIFNVAVGGNWPGAPDDNTVLPQRMIVDYVRVFQQ